MDNEGQGDALSAIPEPSARTPPSQEQSPVEQWPSGANKGIKRISYTHDAMIDLILANPAISQNQLAAHFGYTASWVSQIIASDAFQMRLAERSGEINDPAIRATMDERFRGLVLRSLEIIREKLDRASTQVPDNLALRTLELSARALGYGARPEAQPVRVNMETHLTVLGQNLTKLLRKERGETFDQPPVVPGPAVLEATLDEEVT